MPELPEVEVTRRSFADRIAGARIEAVRSGKPLRWPLGIDPQALAGRVVRGVRRRGKWLLIDLDHGLLLLHLGMSGSLSFAPKQPAAGTHDHFDLVTSQGTLRLNDPRRFGAVVYAPREDSPQGAKLLGGLGVEPLSDDFDAKEFHEALKKRNTAIKQVLLAGSRISRPRAARLHQAIRDVLTRAVDRGGSTLRDFSNAWGEEGYFQLEAMVYDRAGEPCRVCGTPVKAIRQGQRATYYCPHCQKS
jgi:formamidopyrimidine-DNA glycosylase